MPGTHEYQESRSEDRQRHTRSTPGSGSGDVGGMGFRKQRMVRWLRQRRGPVQREAAARGAGQRAAARRPSWPGAGGVS